MISRHILSFMTGSSKTTSDIEAFGLSIGYNQQQVDGAIGYLRSQGLIGIVSIVINPANNRKEHLFR